MTKEVDDLLRENLKLNGHSHNRKFFRELLGVKKSRGNELYNKWFKTVEPEGIPATVEIKTNDKYSYNTENDTYVINLKSMAKPFVLQGFIHRAIHQAYSSMGNDLSSEEICRKYGISPEIFSEYRKIFKVTKDSLPLTQEVIESNSVDDSSNEILEQKKFRIFQDFEKKSWKETQERANRWTQYQIGVLDPIENILSNWSPPECKPYEIKKDYGDGTVSLQVCLSDLHVGMKSNPNVTFRGRGYSTEYAVQCIRELHQRITKDAKEMNWKISKIIVLSLGDQLNSANPYSTTTKGTVVKSDYIGEEMFDIALDALVEFIYHMSLLAPVKTVSCRGNHWGSGDSILFKAISLYFKDQKNMEFIISKAPAVSFRERNTLCIASHGAHDSIKAQFGPGNKTQAYIQSLMLHAMENEKGITSRAAWFGDKHHVETKEYNDFTYYLCPSLVGSDEYSDALGLCSRSAQSVFLIDDTGVKATFNYYF